MLRQDFQPALSRVLNWYSQPLCLFYQKPAPQASILYLRISSFLLRLQKNFPLVYCKSPQTVEEKKFFFDWSPKFLWKLSPVSPPTTDFTYTLTSLDLPQENRVYFRKVTAPRELGADGIDDTLCPFQLDGHEMPKVPQPGDGPGLPVQMCTGHPDRDTVTSAGMAEPETLDTAAKFFLAFQGAQQFLHLDRTAIVQSLHGMDEQRLRVLK